MPSRASIAAADATVRVLHAEAERAVSCEDEQGRAAARRLERLLAHADALLGARLRTIMQATGGPDVRFSAVQASAYREQIRLLTEYTRARLGGLTQDQARAAVAASMGHTVDALARMEEHFTGIAIPTRLRQALTFDATSRGVRASLLRQHATSVDRYQATMIEQMETSMAAGMIGGFTQWDMVNALTGHGGPRGQVSMRATVVDGQVVRLAEEEIPEGLFTRYRYWAWRIVRTETASAYNEARLAGIAEMRSEFPDLGKKILAVFDSRTAYDSVVVHGQIRPVDGYFTDGAGRQYQRPPGRPNDRETIIPWRMGWPETPSTAPLTPEQIGFIQRRLGTSGVRGQGRERDVEAERQHLAERGTARRREQAVARRALRAQGLTVQPAHEPTPHEEEQAAIRQAEDQATGKAAAKALRAQARAARAAAAEEKRRAAAFRALATDRARMAPGGMVEWDTFRVGSVTPDPNATRGHIGQLHVDDPTVPGRIRFVRSQPFRTKEEAMLWVARQRHEAEEEVRAARVPPRPPAEARAERLRAAGLGHLVDREPGTAFASRDEAHRYLRAIYRAEEVDVGDGSQVTARQMQLFADRLNELPAAQMEHLHARGTAIRILPGFRGVGADPTWTETGGASTDARDTRTWADVEGAYSGRRDTVWWSTDRTRREILAGESDTAAHEVGHALSRQPFFRMSDTEEFQRVLVEHGGRDALRQSGGWYISDPTREGVEESWAEGYALANSPRGRVWLEANCPPLLRYYERVQQTYEREGSIRQPGRVLDYVARDRAGLDASGRRIMEWTPEEQAQIQQVLARRHAPPTAP